VPLHDDRALFEMLCLEGAQAGLSWLTILRKREDLPQSIRRFDAEKWSATAPQTPAMMLDPASSENRPQGGGLHFQARTYLEIRASLGSFDDYIWQFTGGEVLRRRPCT